MLTWTALIPVLSRVLLNATTCILLTIPAQHRLYFLPALLVPAAISFKTAQHLSGIPGLLELWGLITLITLTHVSSLLYIKKWTLRTTRKARQSSQVVDTWLNIGLWARLYRIALNPRFISVPYKDVISSQQSTGGQVKSTATHKRFSLKKIFWLLISVVM